MTGLDLSRPHVVTAPHKYFAASWWAACTCGAEFFGATADEVREAARPHRDAERERVGKLVDRDRDEARRRRREASRGGSRERAGSPSMARQKAR